MKLRYYDFHRDHIEFKSDAFIEEKHQKLEGVVYYEDPTKVTEAKKQENLTNDASMSTYATALIAGLALYSISK